MANFPPFRPQELFPWVFEPEDDIAGDGPVDDVEHEFAFHDDPHIEHAIWGQAKTADIAAGIIDWRTSLGIVGVHFVKTQ